MRKLSRKVGISLLSSAVVVGFAIVAGVAVADENGSTDETPARLVVGFKPGSDVAAAARRASKSGARMSSNNALSTLGVRTVAVPDDERKRVESDLRKDPNVAFVEVDRVVHKFGDVTPNDPQFKYQPELAQLSVPAAWNTTTGSAAVTIAVLDTGVSPIGELSGALETGYDFVNGDDDPTDDSADGHGTGAAALIAGRGNDGAGIAGLCWQCKILPVKVLDEKGVGLDSTVADGITYAADRGAKIINLSLGTYGRSTLLQLATDYARNKGAVVVAAAGNNGTAAGQTGKSDEPTYPAANAGVLAIGGVDTDNTRYLRPDPHSDVKTGSSGGPWVDLAAPYCATRPVPKGSAATAPDAGTDADPGASAGTEKSADAGANSSDADADAGYDVVCGTSIAAPLVSGVAALVRSRFPAANVWSVEHSLTSTALPLAGGWVANGLVRADRAVTTIDQTAPKVIGATPASWARVRGVFTVTATGVSDVGGTGLDKAQLYADGRLVGTDYAAPFAVNYASGTRNGTVKFQWKVFDRAGNSTWFTRSVIADNILPSVAFGKAPKNNAKVKGTVTVKVTAKDAGGIGRVELLVNGKVVAKDYAAGYSFSVKVAKYAMKKGNKFKVQVRAIDRAGNARISAARTWKR